MNTDVIYWKYNYHNFCLLFISFKGEPGYTGIIGMPGLKGERGFSGIDCVKGIQGPRGVPGLRGLPGKIFILYTCIHILHFAFALAIIFPLTLQSTQSTWNYLFSKVVRKIELNYIIIIIVFFLNRNSRCSRIKRSKRRIRITGCRWSSRIAR